MKKKNLIHLLAISTLSLLLFHSCEEDDNLSPEGTWQLSIASQLLPAEASSIVLDETTNGNVNFSWDAAESSEGFGVTYQVSLFNSEDTAFQNPFLTVTSSNRGEATAVSISHAQIDEAMSFAGYPVNTASSLIWGVKATSLDKTSIATQPINFTRFENEIIPTRLFISGTATPDNGTLANATRMKRLNGQNQLPANVYETYIELKAGESFRFYSANGLPALQYGGEGSTLIKDGSDITVDAEGVYRIRVDITNETYELLEINDVRVVGASVDNSVPPTFTYQDNGTWKGVVRFNSVGSYAFQFNQDSNYILQKETGSQNTLIIESDASSQGVTTEDLTNELGPYEITLSLNFDGYLFVSEFQLPDSLFLIENGTMIKQFEKNSQERGFFLDEFIPMQASANYSLNTLADGTGTAYNLSENLADSNTPNNDSVTGSVSFTQNSNSQNFSVVSNRGLRLSIDFATSLVNWEYLNFKLFHWADNDWDGRQETLMTYEHPNTYVVNANLTAGYNSKFFSPVGNPWAYQMGSETPEELSGNLTNSDNPSFDLKNIENSGSYSAKIILNQNYQSGTYEFVEQ